MKEAIVTQRSPRPVGPYSQGIRTEGLVFVAGQGPADAATNAVPDGIEGQTRQVMRNIEGILGEAGLTLDDVVKVSAHLADLRDFEAFNRVYSEFFRPPYPVRTTVGSQLLGILVEVDVIAVRNG